MGVLAVPDENSSRMTHGMSDVSYPPFSETRVLAVPDESSSRTIALYENTSCSHGETCHRAMRHGPRLSSHTNSVKLCTLTRVVRQIDILTAFPSCFSYDYWVQPIISLLSLCIGLVRVTNIRKCFRRPTWSCLLLLLY